MIAKFSILIRILIKILFKYYKIVEIKYLGSLACTVHIHNNNCLIYFTTTTEILNTMKRRRVSNPDQNKSSDGSVGFPIPPVTGISQLNDSPSMLNTVFEVLLPLEPKISQNPTFDNSNLINNENNLGNKKYHKSQFNLCKKCGGLDEYCECVASGDFETINSYPENVPIKMEVKPEPVAEVTHPEDEQEINEPQHSEHSDEQNDHESLLTPSYINDTTSNCTIHATNNPEEIEDSLTKVVDEGSPVQNINTTEESRETTTSETVREMKSEEISFFYEEVNYANQRESENEYESSTQSLSESNIPKTLLQTSEKNESDISSDEKDNDSCMPQKFEDLASSSSAIESQQPSHHKDFEDNKEFHTIKEPAWDHIVDRKSSSTYLSTSRQSTSHLITPLPSSSRVSTTVLSTFPSDLSETPGENDLQIFEQMDLDDTQLDIPPKIDLSLLEELREAEKKSKKTAHLINQIKDSIKQFQSKENLTEEDALVIKIKQVELAKKLAEFEEIARRVQNLIGIGKINNMENPIEIIEEADEHTILPKDEPELEQETVQVLDDEIHGEIISEKAGNDFSENLNEAAEQELAVVEEEINKTEEIELIQTQSNMAQHITCDKMSYLGKDSEVTNFLMMDKIIPKVIVCGSQDSMPRVIVCEKPNVPSSVTSPFASPPPFFPDYNKQFALKGATLFDKKIDVPDMMISLSGRLSESYLLQERLASENAALEDGRYILQEELLKRDNIVDALQKKVGCLQTEMRIVAKENQVLQEKLEEYSTMDPCSCVPAKKPSRMSPGAPGGFNQNNAANLERQLNMIEGEVRTMQSELQQVQKERQQLEQQRKLLKCSSNAPICMSRSGLGAGMATSMPKTCVCGPIGGSRGGESPELQLRELREQYARLEDDFKNKVAEVSSLRREVEKWKCKCESAKEAQEAAEEECRCIQSQLKTAEQDKKKMLGSREQMMEQEQQLNIAKQRFREAQDELDELRALIQDQTTQLEDYRNKYLQAQQQVEEQRRQIDVMEMENSRISDQVNLEIQRVKAQFQEKLQELTPLPDILKATQMKLQECQQARLLSERNCEELAVELQTAKEQVNDLQRSIEINREDNDVPKLDALQEKVQELKDENGRLRSELIRLDEIAAQAQRRLEEKSHDAAQLAAQLDTVREESARQVARTKDRAETMRRSLQCQISEMERQLAQSRAAARSAQKDRDEIRQRMQCQINNLNESFEQAQLRIRSLQSHVNFLKSSYSNIFEPNCPNLNPAITECACPAGGQDYNF